MPKKRSFARISITLPQETLAAADRLARALDRSRSWVIGEAIRRYGSAESRTAPRGVSQVRGPRVAGYAGLGEQRLAQLAADLRLTPEQRVREAEQTAKVSELVRPPGPGLALRFFDRYEDYLDWKRREQVLR